MEELYCIKHEEMTCPENGTHEVLHLAIEEGAAVIEGGICSYEYGLAFCPPPEEFFLVGHHDYPSPEEIEELNSIVTELFTDWS